MLEIRLQPFLDLERSYRAAQLLLADMNGLREEVGKLPTQSTSAGLFRPAQAPHGPTRWQKLPTITTRREHIRELTQLVTDGRLVWAVADMVATYCRRTATGFSQALGWVAKLDLHQRYQQIVKQLQLMPVLLPAIDYVTRQSDLMALEGESGETRWESKGANDGEGFTLRKMEPLTLYRWTSYATGCPSN